MKIPVCGRLAAALGAALIVLALGGVADAQKLYTDREVELRSSPGDDSQVVKRVAKGKSLEVVKRLGTWVRVKYEGRTGWVRRTALSSERGGGGGDDDAKGESAKEEEEPKAAAAGAKRTAAKKKAERRKSRAARHKSVGTEEEEETADQEEPEDGDSGKPRSTWSERSREAGGPMKVEVQALSVRAFSKRNGKGKVVFTLSEGDRVRVVERGENRWLLVENGKKNTGWVPASAVRDSGDIPEARKSSRELEAEAGDEEEAAEEPKRASRRSDDEDDDGEGDEESSSSKKSKKTRTAAADDEGESSDDDSSSSDDAEASLSDTSDDAMIEKPKPWTFVGSLHAGFTAVGMDVTPTGQDAETVSYNGPIAGLDGELMYRIRPKIGILAQVGYDWSTALGGLTYQAGAGDEITDISLMTHRIGASAGVAYGKRAVGSLRLGYQYMSFQISDLANQANLPRETTSGPTAGLGFSYAELAGQLGVRVGVDAMLLGSRSQTEGLRDGTEFDSLTSLWGSLRLDYPIGKSLVVDGGYRFGYASATWTGVSERNGGTDTERTETSHEISVGAGWRL